MKDNRKEVLIRKLKYLQTFIFPLFIVLVGIAASIVAFYGLFYVISSTLVKGGLWN